MSNKKISKASLKTAKQSNSMLSTSDVRWPILPSWAIVALLGCIRHGKVCIYTTDHKNGMDQPPESSTLIADVDFYLLPEQQTENLETKQQLAQEVLDQYLGQYEQDQLPLLGDFKTFEKSMKSTIAFLIQMENKKGKRFMIYPKSEDYPAKDVRLFTDLVYLEQKGYIELPELSNIVAIDQEVEELEVKLLVPAEDIATQLLPPEPDCQYLGLQCFVNQKKFVYNGKEHTVLNMEFKWVRLLRHMMEHKTRFPWTQAVSMLKIKKKADDVDGKKALENIVYESVNDNLNKWKFPQELGFSEKHIVWKDVN